MYSYIRGILTERDEEGVVVDCQGLGFDLQIGPVMARQLGELGNEVTVYTHFHMTQDNQQLYAFPDKESRTLFRLLITVSGIGPKVAMNVLEAFNPASFAIHVMKEDIKALTTVKGVGKRSAERIIVDLRDKIKKSEWADAGAAAEDPEIMLPGEDHEVENEMKREVLEGLSYLGFNPAEAKKMLAKSFDPAADLEENLKKALSLARKV